jgi:hypothetical protein
MLLLNINLENFDPEDFYLPSLNRHDPNNSNYHSSKKLTILSLNSFNYQTQS